MAKGLKDKIFNKGIRFLKDILACANECKKKSSCCSFEWGESSRTCKLHQSCNNDQKRFADFFSCRKEGIYQKQIITFSLGG